MNEDIDERHRWMTEGPQAGDPQPLAAQTTIRTPDTEEWWAMQRNQEIISGKYK